MNGARTYRSGVELGEKDYASESAFLLRLIRRLSPNPETLLDVACGEGGHLKHLSNELKCEGVDIDPVAIEKARANAPGALFEVADMESMALGRQFDVVTCLFSSIAYVDSVKRLNQTVSIIAAHVKPGALLLIEPWIMPERWLDENSQLSEKELALAKAQIAGVEPTDRGCVTTEILFGDQVSVKSLSEAPRLGWFMLGEYAEALEKAGFQYEFEAEGLTGRGLFSGVKKG